MSQKRIWLTTLRMEKNLTQKELAKKCNISNRTVSMIELGNRTPSGDIAYKMAKELDFDMSKFYE